MRAFWKSLGIILCAILALAIHDFWIEDYPPADQTTLSYATAANERAIFEAASRKDVEGHTAYSGDLPPMSAEKYLIYLADKGRLTPDKLWILGTYYGSQPHSMKEVTPQRLGLIIYRVQETDPADTPFFASTQKFLWLYRVIGLQDGDIFIYYKKKDHWRLDEGDTHRSPSSTLAETLS